MQSLKDEGIVFEELSGKICGTCRNWDHKSSLSARTGFIIPNCLCKCKLNVKVPVDLPHCIKKEYMRCDEGEGCHAWEDCGEKRTRHDYVF